MIYTQEQIAERGYVYAMPPPPRYPRPQQRARSPGASASGAGPSTAVVAAAANATPPATVPPTGPRTARQLLQLQREQHLTDDELLSVMIDSMEDGGFSGMLGNDQKAAILALRGGKVLNERERTSTYFAADDRMLAINIKLDEMDLKLANSYSVHSSSKIDMLHVKARVLAQIIWGATGSALVDVEEGQTTRSPRAWAEVAFLTGASTIKYARDCAAEVIGASVAWRLCAAARPTLMAEYAAGEFSLDAFMRVARRVVSIRLSFTQASGLTPKDARITMNHNGIFDWDALVEEAITASAERLGRGRKRTQRLRELVLKMHQNPSDPASAASARATIEAGLQLTAAQVDGALPTEEEYVEPLPDELADMLAPGERTIRPTRIVEATGAGAAAAGAAVTTTPPPPPPPRRSAAATTTRRIAGTAVPAAVMTTAAAGANAPAGRRAAKRVASAGRRGGEGDGAGARAGAAEATAPRRQRVVGPSFEGEADEAAAESNVLELSPAVLATRAGAEGEALDVPAFVAKKPASNDALFDFIAQVPPDMVGFAIRLLREAENAGLLGGSGTDGSGAGSSTGGGDDAAPTSATNSADLFFKAAEAYDDAALLVQTLDRSGGQALAGNRALIRGAKLLAMGFGSCFSSFMVLLHDAASSGSDAAKAAEWAERIYGDRLAGSAMFVVFVDPERAEEEEEGDDGGDNGARPGRRGQAHYELVFSDGLRVKLRHGIVLVPQPGGKTWRVERVGGAGNKKLVELRFYVSRVASETLGGGEVQSAAGVLIEGLATRGVTSRCAAFEMFARGP